MNSLLKRAAATLQRLAIPTLGVLALGAAPALAQFTSGRVVVLQAGDGSGTLAATGNPIVLKEFTPAGAAGFSLPVPSTGANALIMAGNATTEGNLSLSSDGSQLVFGGYAQTLPNATALAGSASATINRAIGSVDASGNFSRLFPSATAFSAGNIRAVASDGTNYWASGSNQGVNYFGPGTPGVIATGKTNLRAAAVFNGQLYVSSQSSAGTPANVGVFAVGSGLPTTTGQTLATTVLSAATSNGFFLSPSGNELYVGTSAGVEKWTFSGSWSLAYSMTFTGGAGSVVADFSGGSPVVYATVGTGPANSLVRFTDPGVGGAVTPTTLATAPTNTSFRGVAFAPAAACNAPTVTADPSGASVCVGAAPVQFSVVASGTAPLSYQWRLNGVDLTNGGAFSGVTTDTLTVDPLSAAEAGNYDCVVTNACGNDTSGAAALLIDTLDSDGDGIADCNDGCPNDPNKVAPGACGCGVADTDTDGDGTPDCNDQCPTDPNKVAPGACGCGVPDIDTDGDGTLDCLDQCPNDPNKVAPGDCGCGVADTDSDGDGVADCNDGCPNDPNKVGPGACGCGVADTDSDGDGTPDCLDQCPTDPNKVAPGACGCGIPDTDSDGDGTPDCLDQCPNDPNKVAPGDCGCGVADTDTDGDGVADCNDQCPTDPNKVAPGACGCGIPDTDTDGDGTPDCLDQCPNDPNKVAPGDCGCGVADTDTDGDGTADCLDQCPNDPNKVDPGVCGCGVADVDTDGDGTLDCLDQCPNDPNKVAPGDCGCGVADVDTDGDGALDCQDSCPNDPNKIVPGVCGCGVADVDTDGDGTLDCLDLCPTDPTKIAPGLCGCTIPEGCSLGIDVTSISVATGGEQQLFLYAGAQNAGKVYLLIGSLSGTTPGVVLAPSVTLPLNFDTYLQYTLGNPNSPPLSSSFGVLDINGQATAKLTLNPLPNLVGLPITGHHAYVLLDLSPLAAAFASNAAPVLLVP